MESKRMSEFGGKGAILLFRFPLYTKIKIDTSVETKEDTEIIGYDEEGVPDILSHLNFIENRDFRFLKKLVTEEHNFFYYCPFCERELPIIYKGQKLNDEQKDQMLTTYSYMYNMTEEVEGYYELAKEKFIKRYNEFRGQIFGENNVLQMNLECTSKHKHKLHVFFQVTDDNHLIKTGQYPSIMDFDNSLKEYKKVLKDKNITRELTNATILKTYNMGVGGFLYLRRIFEKLIFEKFEQAKSEQKIDEQIFNNAKTKEKVAMLHELGYLPSYITEINTFIYDILSKGVHELSEEECMLHYDTVKQAIIHILEEKVELEQKEKSKQRTKSELNKIHSKLPK